MEYSLNGRNQALRFTGCIEAEFRNMGIEKIAHESVAYLKHERAHGGLPVHVLDPSWCISLSLNFGGEGSTSL